MKNLIVILVVSVVSVVLISCSNKEVDNKVVVPINSVTEELIALDFSNPAFMVGSSFGIFFVSMIRTQNYDMALKFTSKESIEKFGVDKIKVKYENFKFNYILAQKSITKKGNIFTIAYTTNEYATGKIKKMTVALENDSCKIVLPDNLDDLLR